MRWRKTDKVRSPCVGVCVIDNDTGWCRGCRRTLEEVAFWDERSDEEKKRIAEALPERIRKSPHFNE